MTSHIIQYTKPAKSYRVQCPHQMYGIYHYHIVGSIGCQTCPFFISKDSENKTVECAYTDALLEQSVLGLMKRKQRLHVFDILVEFHLEESKLKNVVTAINDQLETKELVVIEEQGVNDLVLRSKYAPKM